MEEEREIDLYLAEQEFCEEMCEEVERLYVESAVPAATEPPVTKPSATELAAALAAEPVSAAITPSAAEPAFAARAAAVSAASEPSPAKPVSAAIKPSATESPVSRAPKDMAASLGPHGNVALPDLHSTRLQLPAFLQAQSWDSSPAEYWAASPAKHVDVSPPVSIVTHFDLAWALKSRAAGLTMGSRPPPSEPRDYNPPRVKRPPIRAHQPERRFRKRHPQARSLVAAERLTNTCRLHRPRVERSPPPIVRQTAFIARTDVVPLPVKKLDFDAVEMLVASPALSPPEEHCSREPADDHVLSKELLSAQCLPPDDLESTYDNEGHRQAPPPPVEQCASQGGSRVPDARVPATPPPSPPVASAVDSWEQHAELLTIQPPRHARLRKHRRLRHRLEYKRVHCPDGSCEHSRLRRDMFCEPEVEPPPQPPRPYDDEFLSPRPPLIYNPDVYTESANKLWQLRWRQIVRKLNLPPCGATTKQKRDALRATAATDAQYAEGESVDERQRPDYGLRGLDDEDVFFDEEVYDNIWGDPIVATRRQPCATPSLAKRDEQALVSQRPVSPKSLLELSLDASSAAPRHEQLDATRIRESMQLALQAAQKMGHTVYGYQLEVVDGELRLMVFAGPLESPAEWAATHIQSHWRGVLGRDNYQAAKQAKAKKERRAKRAAAKGEAIAMQLASDEKLQSATTPTSPSEPPAEQPAADSVDELAATPSSGVAAPKPTLALAANTPLWEAIGWRLANKEPRVGGMCMMVALLESPIAKEDFLHRLLDHLEHDADAANTVASYHEFAEKEIKTFELKSLRHAVRRVLGVSDVANCVAKVREPIGYRLGARLIAPLPVAVLFAAASYMKLDIVVLDASTATPLYAIVRCSSSHPVLLHMCRC